ncbi:MAG: solute-binding protein [Planctomycetaceae bacterium]|jgi:iron(III) transport system substrate-binding protein|nr:solute-binding protein [Planctomycetaceae bacterium]MBT6154446.1 solute-binding protein [Planctomycetaceae bacterium]MBT6487257.1 solute-binding protein [Planctomycetaceae bacterium]MBT6498257.1 solute-binding protein [Planctomycetaceae bacterium]
MTAKNKPYNWFAFVVAGAAIAGAVTLGSGGCSSDQDALVVYCAHDQVFSERILRRFEQETGIRVIPRFDTEATKSLGLTNLLISEQKHPRCDVFWNNQVLGTAELGRQGILQAYKGVGYRRIPEAYKDPDGYWTGFAARLRVYIVNTDLMQPTAEEIERRFAADDLSRIAVARPMFGTTLSHYSVLWNLWKPDRLKQWHDGIRRREISEVAGNSTVMNLVAKGTCDLGWTDTDDFFVAKDRGDPVAMLPIRVSGETICIPNSVAIIKGTKKLQQAQQLVDFLLSAETELELATSKSRQIPLGPVKEDDLPPDVRPLQKWAEEGYDLSGLAQSRGECLAWLKSENLR